MRLWSEEKKQGTLEMLITFPVKSWEVVGAKFLAAYTILAVSLILTGLVVPSPRGVLPREHGLDRRSSPTTFGAFLIAGVYIAIGAWISALTENQVVAFIVSILACFLLCFLGLAARDRLDRKRNLWDGLGRFVGYFGVYFHYQKFAQGQVSAVDVVYTLGMIGLFLGLNNFAVESRKY